MPSDPANPLIRYAPETNYAKTGADGMVLLDHGRAPWERQHYESTKAYQAFALYKDMGTGRKITDLSKELGKNYRFLKEWSSRYSWSLRTRLFDEWVAQEEEKAFLAERKGMARRQARLGQSMQEAAGTALEMMNLEEVGAQDVARLADTGVKIERLAREASTENAAAVVEIRWDGPRPAWADKATPARPNEGG